MQVGNIRIGKDLLFIIEEGQFNLGDFGKALQFIELAAKTGANAIEFQLAYADDFYIKSDTGHGIYKTREFSDEQLRALVDNSKQQGLEFIATCLSHRLVSKMTEFGCSAFNLNASDINNTMMIDNILETGKSFFVSLPLATLEEITWTVDYIRNKKPSAEFALLHGQHSMASGKESVDIADTSLGFIRAATEHFGVPVGFIDHTKSLWMPGAAIAAGASVVSKHMTISHLYKGPDWQICLNPEEMKQSVAIANQIFQSANTADKVLANDEKIDRSVMRRSVVSARRIEKGAVIQLEDLCFKRPGTGIAPSSAGLLAGKTATQDIEIDTIISETMFN